MRSSIPPTFVGRFLGAFLNDLVPDDARCDRGAAVHCTRAIRLWQNLLEVSHMTPEQVETAPHKIVGPKDCDLSPPEMVSRLSRRHAARGIRRDTAPLLHPARSRASSTCTSSAAPATARPRRCST